MAQAGATLIRRGLKPAKRPLKPFSDIILYIIFQVELDLFCELCNTSSSPTSICLLVFTTSNGKVTRAAIDPDKAPDAKLIEKVGSVLLYL